MDREILNYYNQGREERRLAINCRWEGEHTRRVLERFLPSPPCRVADVGGGPCAYAVWLMERGYDVDLVDPVPLHVEQATQAFRERGNMKATGQALEGDARAVPLRDHYYEAALLLGPLYHLTALSDRSQALSEAARLLKEQGILFAAACSRYAGIIDEIVRGGMTDGDMVDRLMNSYRTGQYRNPDENYGQFTTAYFHTPEELRDEIVAVGFHVKTIVGLEGPYWLSQHQDRYLNDARLFERAMSMLEELGEKPSLLGMSGHLLVVAER